jgi:16S rRNA (cytosine967-C5)-methyltransferase
VDSGSDARAAALQTLTAVRGGSQFEAALDAAAAGLEDTDRRLTYEIAAGVLRSRTELDSRLAPLLGDWERTPDETKDILRIGAYQLLKLSRVPGYAAVQSTVEAAKRSGGRKSAGLVNAVLRRLSRTAGQREPEGSLAARHSHPDWLVERWLARWGEGRTEALLQHNNRRPPLVIQPAGGSVEALGAALSEAGVPHSPAAFRAGLAVESGRVWELPGFGQGTFVVQDPAQARLLEFAAIPDGATVWDACSAPGGKAAVLARRCTVVACERRRERLGRLRDTLARVAPEVPVVLADAARPPLRPGAVDVALVDAPCSATGTMARHPDARWRLSPEQIGQAARWQRAILDGAATVVGPGALLLYMTCSLEPEENELQADGFLDRHPEFEREGDDLFIFPPDEGTDGGYAARLRRTR